MLNMADSRGENIGLSVARGGVRINHLLFADDYVMFGRATRGDRDKLQNILNKYEKSSGQVLNKIKTSMSFSSSTRMRYKRMILSTTNAVVCGNYEKWSSSYGWKIKI